jgi:hypothetical protein
MTKITTLSARKHIEPVVDAEPMRFLFIDAGACTCRFIDKRNSECKF